MGIDRIEILPDVPEFANLDSPTIPEGDEANGEPNETQEDRDAQQALHEPPPPPFPYPTPSTGRLPPAFGTIVLEGAEGRRSPPPSFEVAMRGYTEPAPAGTHEGGDAAHEAVPVEAEDEDENVPSPPSTVSTVRRARIRAETPRERRIREDRERWQRAREEGKDLDHLIRLEKERIERMQHWDRKEEGKAHSISEPQIEEPIRARASDNALRFSREQKGKGRAVYYYDASEQVEDDTVDAPVRSRASSMSTNMARSTIDEEEPDGVELGAVLPTRGNSQEADLDQNGEGSKMSGFVAQELAMAGINVENLVGPEDGARQGPEPAEDQEVQVPGLVQGGETVRSHSPTTPIMHTHALSTVSTSTVQPLEKDKIADPSLSPIAHGSRFLEGISEGPDGQLEVVSGTIEPETSADISKVEPEVSPVAPPVPEKDEPVGDKAAPVTITRKPSLPPLFSRKRSGRKISNPWMLFRQTSTSNRAKAEPEHPTDQATSPGAISPAVESPEVSSPKESGLAKSPFFRAAGQFLKPNLGLESKNVEPKKETTDSTSPLPVAESVIPTRPRQVSTSTVNPPAVSGQPHVAYKHPFNRAVKPAWMQQAAPIWQDPKAYVMDEDRPADSTAEVEVKAIPRVQVVNEPVVDDWEIVSSPKKPEHDETAAHLSPLPNTNGQRKASPAIPPRRPEAPGFPPPRLATSKAQDATSPSSESSAGESDTSDDSDSETSSDAWSVSDAVARPPAAYRLLPPRGIPANVLRAANEPPPLPRRARENRPKPMGPRQRVPPPPLPPRTRPSAVTPKPKEEANHADVSTSLSTQAPPVIATPAAVVPKSGTVEPSQPAVSTPVTDNAAKGQATESAVPKKRIIPQVDTPLTMSQPTTPGIISSTRPTAGDRTPSAISGFFNKNGNNEDDRGRSRSYSAGLRPLTIANNDSSKVDSAPKVSPLPQAVPVVFPQSKPLRLAAAPIGGQSRPKATHHATSPAERRSKPAAARLAIKPRYDDRPEQELKSQLSNRINKWRLAAIRPDAPETWEPTEEDDIPPIDRRNPANGFTRSKSMPNFVPDTVEEAIPAAAAESPVGGPEASQPSLSPASPQPTGHENGGTRQIRQRTVSSKTQRSSQPREVDSTAAVPTPQPIAAPVPTARAANQSLEYTDLDLAAAQLQGTAREYEVSGMGNLFPRLEDSADLSSTLLQGMNAITSFVGEEIPRGASPDSLSNLMLGPVEVESRRTTKEGKTKLKLTALGIRVHKCSICLSQFKAGDIMAMMPKCSHLGHQRCVVNWLTKDARCMVCREPL